MATENPDGIVSRQAGTNVTNKRFVKEAAGGIVNRCDTQGERGDGVCAMISTGFTGSVIGAGQEAPVAKDGDIIVESGAAVNDAVEVMTDNVGRAITFVAGGGAIALGRVVNGSSATAAGQDLSIEFYEPSQHV